MVKVARVNKNDGKVKTPMRVRGWKGQPDARWRFYFQPFVSLGVSRFLVSSVRSTGDGGGGERTLAPRRAAAGWRAPQTFPICLHPTCIFTSIYLYKHTPSNPEAELRGFLSLRGRELSPGLPRDRQKYWPLYYSGSANPHTASLSQASPRHRGGAGKDTPPPGIEPGSSA